MKKIFTLLLVMSAVFVNAQSIKLFYGDTPMNNNDTVFVPFDDMEDALNVYFGYQNITDADIEFRVHKEVIFQGEGTLLTFCIGDCYTGEYSRKMTLEAGRMVPSTDEMALHTIFEGRPYPTLVRYTFFKNDDESDCVSFYIYYGGSVGLRETDMVKVLRAFPNPASKMVNIDFAAPEQNANLVIKNLTGKEVYRTPVSNIGRKQVDVSSFSPGVYLYGVESAGRMICTKKLLVK